MTKVSLRSLKNGASIIYSNDDLTVTIPNNVNHAFANLGRTLGKYFFEVKIESNSTGLARVGIANMDAPNDSTITFSANARQYYGYNGRKLPDNVDYADTFGANDVIGVALDLDNGTLGFYKNGVFQGMSHNDIETMGEVFPMITNGSSSNPVIATVNFGATPFEHPIPHGYRPYSVNKILLLSSDKTCSVNVDNIDLIPKMTSNTAPSGVASASSVYSSYDVWMAFNKTLSNQDDTWIANSNIGWIRYSFTNRVNVSKYALASRIGNPSNSPKDWTFEGSNDGGATWDILDTQINIVDWIDNNVKEFTLNQDSFYSDYKINITKNNGGARLSIGEFYLIEAIHSVNQLPSHSEENFINYGINSPIGSLDSIFSNKNYILSPTESKNENGLLTTQINRKPRSIMI